MVFKYFPIAKSLSHTFPVQEMQETIFKLGKMYTSSESLSPITQTIHLGDSVAEMIGFLSFSMLWELFLIARNIYARDV